MIIKLSRKPHNTRFGSLAWAATLPADKWMWKLTRYGDSTDRVDVYNGDTHLASIDPDFDLAYYYIAGQSHEAIEDSIKYGGEAIGEALMYRLLDWADTLDLTADNQGDLQIVSAK